MNSDDTLPEKISHTHYVVNLDIEGRTFVCSDLHGCHDELMDALAKVDFDYSRDRVFVLGDLVDRGPDSFKCLRLLKEPWFHAIKGNHEDMMMNGLPPVYDWRTWFVNGGTWYRDLKSIEQEEVRYLCDHYVDHLPVSLTLVYPRDETGSVHYIGIIHAEPPDDWSEAISGEHSEMESIWGRSRIRHHDSRPVESVDLVLVGHTSSGKIRQLGNVVYLDTGAGWRNGRLTLIALGRSLEELKQNIAKQKAADLEAGHPPIIFEWESEEDWPQATHNQRPGQKEGEDE